MATFTAAEKHAYAKGCAKGEANLAEVTGQLEAANDTIDDLRTKIEADLNANLVEQTWLRMELAKASEARNFWIDEASKWARMFAVQRQKVERYQAQMDVWVDNMKAFAKGGILIDLLVCGFALLVIAGVVPPVFKLWQ